MTTKQYPKVLTCKSYVSHKNDFSFVFSIDVEDWQHSRNTKGKRYKERITYNIDNNISENKQCKTPKI